MGGTVPVVGDKPVFAVEFLSFRLAVMSFDNGYRVGRVEVGKFGEEQFAAELAANRIFYRCLLYTSQWFQIGKLTVKGNPRHPLYARYDWGLVPFKVKKYMTKLK